jgi:hypothetical protein
MAGTDLEQYRAQIDGLIAAAGLEGTDWGAVGTPGYGDKEAIAFNNWLAREPNNKWAQLAASDPKKFLISIAQARVGLRQPNALGEAAKQGVLKDLGLLQSAEEQEAIAQQNQAQIESDRINAQMDAMIDELSRPVIDPVTGQATDSVYDTLLKGGATAGATSAAMRGVGGPLAAQNSVDSANSAALPYLMQRQGLLANAINARSQRDLGIEAQRQSAEQLRLQQQQFNNNVATNNWAAQQNQLQGVLGGIGAAVGGIGGAYVGGPAGAAAGAQLGSGLFAGLGSSMSRGPSLQQAGIYQGAYGGGRGRPGTR